MKEDLDKILNFQKERDWKQFHSPKNLALSLSIEAVEVLDIFQWTKDNSLLKEKDRGLKVKLELQPS